MRLAVLLMAGAAWAAASSPLGAAPADAESLLITGRVRAERVEQGRVLSVSLATDDGDFLVLGETPAGRSLVARVGERVSVRARIIRRLKGRMHIRVLEVLESAESS